MQPAIAIKDHIASPSEQERIFARCIVTMY